MSARKSQLDQAIDKITDDIKVLELARQRLITQRTEQVRSALSRSRKPKRPQPVPKVAGE